MIKQLYRFLSKRHQTVFLDYKVEFKPRYGHGKPPHKELYEIIDDQRSTYESVINSILENKDQLLSIKVGEADRKEPAYNNGFLPGLDIAALYALLAVKKPRRYIEIGSGNSTKVAFKAKNDHGLAMEIVSIDPHPRSEIDELADRIVRKPFENTDLNIAEELESGDVLFIDNSHRILPNSDCLVFFLEILPRLKKGVIVHIHDIYLPYDYPQFMCDRAYSEQYGLAFFLLANPRKYAPLFPAYFVSEDKNLSALLNELWKHSHFAEVERHGGSFWLTVNE